MIPFASQRGSGQDLATHLLNAHDNEYVEVADVRGSIADDLHGAFAEWEVQAHSMTKAKNYLYSLSINPDPDQGPMPRELYEDYIACVEEALGLAGQPRATVYHIKEDKHGVGREHAHVVWSRIDVQDLKAIHMAFDHEKLMTVTRQFARDHKIELAPGYHSLEERKAQSHRQLSLYERYQQDTVGLTREERQEIVTELWHQRDDPKSFIKSLEYHGYILATGKRPYVLVDIYGHSNSLPKLIDDKSGNTKQIRAFLGEEFVIDNLPSVEEAKKLATRYQKGLQSYAQQQLQAEQMDMLQEMQERRLEKLDRQIEMARENFLKNLYAMFSSHQQERWSIARSYVTEAREIREAREANRPSGLTAILSKASGYDFVQKQIHRYQDGKRQAAFRLDRHLMYERHLSEREELRQKNRMEALDLDRQRRGLLQTHARERQSLQQSFEKQKLVRARRGHDHMPRLTLDLKPPGRPAAPAKAMSRFRGSVDQPETATKRDNPESKSLREDFQSPNRGGHQNRKSATPKIRR